MIVADIVTIWIVIGIVVMGIYQKKHGTVPFHVLLTGVFFWTVYLVQLWDERDQRRVSKK